MNVGILRACNDKLIEHRVLEVLLDAVNINSLAADWSESRQLNLSDKRSGA